MKTYRAGMVMDPELRRELSSIQQAAGRADPFVELEVLHAAPAKLRAGMVVYADGVDFDPGSGEGLYVRDKTNSSWRYLG